MAGKEGTIRYTFLINQGNLQISRTAAFNPDVAGAKGPVPGAITVTPVGVDVDFSELTTPGLCIISNLDETSYFEYGIWDPEGAIFYPLGEVLPGESWPLRLARFLQAEYGTGSGTAVTTTNRLRLRSVSGSGNINAVVEAFEL